MTWKQTLALGTGLSVLASASIVLAGTLYKLQCSDKDCGYKGEIGIGGSRLQVQKTGFCVNCGDLVTVRWDRPREGVTPKAPEMKAVGRIWLPTTGEVKPLYPCPKCSQPFLPIDSVAELKCCPKCKKPTLTAKMELIFD
jgi:hypothetical protein